MTLGVRPYKRVARYSCAFHNTYKGLRHPVGECPYCWGVFRTVQKEWIKKTVEQILVEVPNVKEEVDQIVDAVYRKYVLLPKTSGTRHPRTARKEGVARLEKIEAYERALERLKNPGKENKWNTTQLR